MNKIVKIASLLLFFASSLAFGWNWKNPWGINNSFWIDPTINQTGIATIFAIYNKKTPHELKMYLKGNENLLRDKLPEFTQELTLDKITEKNVTYTTMTYNGIINPPAHPLVRKGSSVKEFTFSTINSYKFRGMIPWTKRQIKVATCNNSNYPIEFKSSEPYTKQAYGCFGLGLAGLATLSWLWHNNK